MGFFSKFFGKKNDPNDLLTLIKKNQQNAAISVNYQFSCVSIRMMCFSRMVFEEKYENDQKTVEWIGTILNGVQVMKHIPIPMDFYSMPYHFVHNEDNTVRAIIFEVPNPRFECDCNYVGVVNNKGEMQYYTNEYYVSAKKFRTCEFLSDGSRYSYSFEPKTVEEFAKIILARPTRKPIIVTNIEDSTVE